MVRQRIAGVVFAVMIVVMSLGTVTPLQAQGTVPTAKGELETMSAMDLTLAMQPGWNMGNTLDATGGETSWGNPQATQELLAAIKAEGYNSVRIPVTWQHSVGGSPDYTITEAYMTRVHEVVDWALDLGLIVMINMHHDSSWLHDMPTRGDLLLDRYATIWEQIAESFKDYPTSLIFEAINEPRFSDDWGLETDEYFDIVDQLNNTAYEIIRASGSKNSERKIVMETLVAGITQTKADRLKANILSHNDPNLIASVHYYGLYPFSMNLAGKTSFDDETRTDIDTQMQIIHDTFVAAGIPVILGEYGLLGFDNSTEVIQQGEKLKFFDYLVAKAVSLDITTMLWDNGQHFERNEHYWRDPALHAVIMQAVSGRSSSSEHDTLYVPADAIVDQQLRLNLNGNELTGITDNSGRTWSADSDYSLDGEILTLKGSSIETLTSGVIGRDYSLALQFNDGPDWVQHLFIIGESNLIDIERSTLGFDIPVDFQGDKVRAIKATDRNGSTLSNNSWTPYLSYSTEYTVDYENETINIGAVALSKISEGYAHITVEMWSGLVLPYSITISGSGSIGVASSTPVELEPETTTSETEESTAPAETTETSDSEETEASESSSPAPTKDGVDGVDDVNKQRPLVIALVAVTAAAVIGLLARLFRKNRDE